MVPSLNLPALLSVFVGSPCVPPAPFSPILPRCGFWRVAHTTGTAFFRLHFYPPWTCSVINSVPSPPLMWSNDGTVRYISRYPTRFRLPPTPSDFVSLVPLPPVLSHSGYTSFFRHVVRHLLGLAHLSFFPTWTFKFPDFNKRFWIDFPSQACSHTTTASRWKKVGLTTFCIPLYFCLLCVRRDLVLARAIWICTSLVQQPPTPPPPLLHSLIFTGRYTGTGLTCACAPPLQFALDSHKQLSFTSPT